MACQAAAGFAALTLILGLPKGEEQQVEAPVAICAGAISCPYDGKDEAFKKLVTSAIDNHGAVEAGNNEDLQDDQPRLLVVCRRGNDSQIAVPLMHEAGLLHAVDLIGGLQLWAHQKGSNFPVY